MPADSSRQEDHGRKEWSASHTIYFWDPRSPFDVKYTVEKVTRTLLSRETDQEGRTHLSYAGSRGPPTLGYNLRLCFEAALPEGNWYSLGVVAWIPQTWLSKDDFTPAADRAFEYWSGKFGAPPSARL